MGLLVLLGILAWIGMILNPAPTLAGLRDGLRWIEWRPVPHDLPRRLLVFLGLGLAGQILLAALVSGTTSARETIPIPLLFASMALFQGLAATVIVLHLRRLRLDFPTLFGWRPFRELSPLLHGAAAYAVALPLVIAAALTTQGLFHWLELPFERQPIFDQLGADWPATHLLALFFLIGVVAPVCEELLFRGILFPWLAARFGAGIALVAHSLLFAAIHQHAATLIPLFVLSLLLGLAYARTRNLGVAVWLHAFFNTMNLLTFFLMPEAGL
jgi:hypothetical protein